jgi:hypothetical protein
MVLSFPGKVQYQFRHNADALQHKRSWSLRAKNKTKRNTEARRNKPEQKRAMMKVAERPQAKKQIPLEVTIKDEDVPI